MYNKTAAVLMLHTLTSAHVGSGTELSFVDLPIQREAHTRFPKIEASSIKGSIRSAIRDKHKDKEELITRLFGEADEGSFASAVSCSDARLLFFPVKSVSGIFAWVTCPFAIRRFMDDLGLAFEAGQLPKFNLEKLERANKSMEALITKDSKLLSHRDKSGIMLEDYVFTTEKDEEFTEFIEKLLNNLPESDIMKSRFTDHTALIGDDEFTDFVKYSTEICERIKIKQETGTVQDKALFSEEYLPPECILYHLVFFNEEYQSPKKETNCTPLDKTAVMDEFKGLFDIDVFQIGGDAALGKGLVSKQFWEEDGNGEKNK